MFVFLIFWIEHPILIKFVFIELSESNALFFVNVLLHYDSHSNRDGLYINVLIL